MSNERRASPLDQLLGRAGEPPRCKVFSKDVAVHWFDADAKVGDPCLCGAIRKKPE